MICSAEKNKTRSVSVAGSLLKQRSWTQLLRLTRPLPSRFRLG